MTTETGTQTEIRLATPRWMELVQAGWLTEAEARRELKRSEEEYPDAKFREMRKQCFKGVDWVKEYNGVYWSPGGVKKLLSSLNREVDQWARIKLLRACPNPHIMLGRVIVETPSTTPGEKPIRSVLPELVRVKIQSGTIKSDQEIWAVKLVEEPGLWQARKGRPPAAAPPAP